MADMAWPLIGHRDGDLVQNSAISTHRYHHYGFEGYLGNIGKHQIRG